MRELLFDNRIKSSVHFIMGPHHDMDPFFALQHSMRVLVHGGGGDGGGIGFFFFFFSTANNILWQRPKRKEKRKRKKSLEDEPKPRVCLVSLNT